MLLNVGLTLTFRISVVIVDTAMMESMTITVTVRKVGRERIVKTILMNVHLTLVTMEEPARMPLVTTHVNVCQDTMAMTVRRMLMSVIATHVKIKQPASTLRITTSVSAYLVSRERIVKLISMIVR